jgi:hypothetical protein
MEHILTECEQSRERQTVWKLAKSLWIGTGRRWKDENERDGSIESTVKTSDTPESYESLYLSLPI